MPIYWAVPMSRPVSVAECVRVITDMVEEAQVEAHRCLSVRDRQILLAKRDALEEAKFRMRDGAEDTSWTKRIPAPNSSVGLSERQQFERRDGEGNDGD